VGEGVTMRDWLMASGLAATLIAGQGVAAPITTCDIKLNVIDQDPAGLNVRAMPDERVIGTLPANKYRWVQVHVTGDAGAWAAIDHATLIQDETGGPDITKFKGRGFVAFSKLGIVTLNEGAAIFATPSPDAKVLLKFPDDKDASELPNADALGCDGSYLRLRVSGVVGWTQQFCSNQLTTCN
jgi:hypothetical protein